LAHTDDATVAVVAQPESRGAMAAAIVDGLAYSDIGATLTV
jgi:hypothetical protein